MTRIATLVGLLWLASSGVAHAALEELEGKLEVTWKPVGKVVHKNSMATTQLDAGVDPHAFIDWEMRMGAGTTRAGYDVIRGAFPQLRAGKQSWSLIPTKETKRVLSQVWKHAREDALIVAGRMTKEGFVVEQVLSHELVTLSGTLVEQGGQRALRREKQADLPLAIGSDLAQLTSANRAVELRGLLARPAGGEPSLRVLQVALETTGLTALRSGPHPSALAIESVIGAGKKVWATSVLRGYVHVKHEGGKHWIDQTKLKAPTERAAARPRQRKRGASKLIDDQLGN